MGTQFADNDSKTTTQPASKRNTDYNAGLFQGLQYGSREGAILAGAKSYAKMDWETIKVVNEQNELSITPAMLIEAKKTIIEASLVKRDEMPKEFE